MIEAPEIYAAVLAHVEEQYLAGKREACGLLVATEAGHVYVACRNMATNPREQFRMHPRDRYDAESLGKVLAVVHSHPDSTCEPSPADLIACARSGIPWVVVSYPNVAHRTIEPRARAVPYTGRHFQHGVVDCYTLLQDYYFHELGIALPDVHREDKWWDKGGDLYNAHLESAGFVKVDSPQKHDGILMCIAAPVPNHAGVYLGDDVMLHHMAGRLSAKTTFGGTYWMDHLYGYYRHRSLMK